MYSTRIASEDDIPVIFKFVQLLNSHHINMDGFWRMSEELLRQHFLDRAFEAILLVEKSTGNPQGFLLFSEEYSQRLGKGIYLDEFYVAPEIRGKGLGTLLMRYLCEQVLKLGFQYIKIYYQSGLNLENMYYHMGFVNETTTMHIHLYEYFGKEVIDRMLNVEQQEAVDNVSNNYFHPDNVVSHCQKTVASEELTGNTCSYIQQTTYCSWLGKLLLMSDFEEETKILTANTLRRQVRDYMNTHTDILGIWLLLSDETSALRNVLREDLAMADITEKEGWNVMYLYQDAMVKLTAKRP